MEEKSLLTSLRERLDKVSESEEVVFTHPRQSKSYFSIIKFLEQIVEVRETEKRKLVVIMSGSISHDIKILETALKSFPNIEIVCYSNVIASTGKNCSDRVLIYGVDFGGELDRIVTMERLQSDKENSNTIMKLKPYPEEILQQKTFDFLKNERKGKYSKYHKNNRFHK